MDRRDTLFLRFLAIFLITNSHLDNLYPISHLGTGGAIGNALFFMLSGYGLIMSWQKSEHSFLRWYTRRIMRIYPSLIIIVAIFTVWHNGAWRYWTIKDYINEFIYPTSAWFISAIMIFYIFTYVILRSKNHKIFLAGIIALFIPYFYFYFTQVDLSHYTIEGPGYFKWIFYLQIMLLGGYLAFHPDRIVFKRHYSLIYLLLSILLYYTVGLSFVSGYFAEYQFLMHLLTFAIVYFIFSSARSPFVLVSIMGNRTLAYIIAFISGLTLEIYLLQYQVYTNVFVTSLIFPINIMVFWILVVFLAFIISKASDIIRKLLTSNISKIYPSFNN